MIPAVSQSLLSLWVFIVVLKLGPARRVDPRLELNRVEEKTGEEKILCDPARPGQKPGCNPLTFFFFTKTTSF
jgi:hypothetical protein